MRIADSTYVLPSLTCWIWINIRYITVKLVVNIDNKANRRNDKKNLKTSVSVYQIKFPGQKVSGMDGVFM